MTRLQEKTLFQIRKYLHSTPELSGKEQHTRDYLYNLFEELNFFSEILHIGGTGLMAIYDTQIEGPQVLFRSELDALPIQEINDFEHQSKVENVSHKCGHDGHMTILYGLALRLLSNPIKNGKIYFLFQPAEETGEGAAEMLEQPFFEKLKLDYVFALHNLPGYPQTNIVVRHGTFNASVKSVILYFSGKTSHASEPENGHNPNLAMAELMLKFDEMNKPSLDDEEFRLITIVHAVIGEKAYGVSAGKGELHATLRCWNEDKMNALLLEIENIAKQVCDQYQLSLASETLQHFASNQNNEEAVKYVEHAAEKLGLVTVYPEYPFKWGEDFGLFTERYKGCMFGLGAGEDIPALHNPDYDFPDEILKSGIDVFYQIVKEIFE